jgi:hypothetical protein
MDLLSRFINVDLILEAKSWEDYNSKVERYKYPSIPAWQEYQFFNLLKMTEI